jgi:hypothetical protein
VKDEARVPADNYGIDERFERPSAPPSQAEVAGWPFNLAQRQSNDNDVADVTQIHPKLHDFLNENMPPVNEMNRGSQPPKTAEVNNWPYPQFAQESSSTEGIAKNKYISR